MVIRNGVFHVALPCNRPRPGLPSRGRCDVLPLAADVTSWNTLGWKVPFSLPAATERQSRCGARFGDGSFTPEMMVDGRKGFVGSEWGKAASAISAAKPRAPAPPPPPRRQPIGSAMPAWPSGLVTLSNSVDKGASLKADLGFPAGRGGMAMAYARRCRDRAGVRLVEIGDHPGASIAWPAASRAMLGAFDAAADQPSVAIIC